MAEAIALELARIEREAIARVQARMAAQQKGEAFANAQGGKAHVRNPT